MNSLHGPEISAGFNIAKDQSLHRLYDNRSDVLTAYTVVTMASSP